MDQSGRELRGVVWRGGDSSVLGGEAGVWCDSTLRSELWWEGEGDVAQSNLLKNRFNLFAQSWSPDSGLLPFSHDLAQHHIDWLYMSLALAITPLLSSSPPLFIFLLHLCLSPPCVPSTRDCNLSFLQECDAVLATSLCVCVCERERETDRQTDRCMP